MKTIVAEGISKRYRIGEYKAGYQTLRDTLAHTARRMLLLEHVDHSLEELWALKDVSFTVDEGEVVGFIGRNGSGKSTLLKVLTRITPPTEGVASIRGRVGSILEVGTGFHPELTGKENVFLRYLLFDISFCYEVQSVALALPVCAKTISARPLSSSSLPYTAEEQPESPLSHRRADSFGSGRCTLNWAECNRPS